MARTFTVAALRTQCQRRCNLEGHGLISDSEWNGLISTAYAELYSILVESGMRYFETVATISTTGADVNGAFALPAGHLATVGVDYVNGTDRTPLDEAMAQERNTLGRTRGTSTGWALVGSNLVISPPPTSGQTYEHVYVPQPTDYTAAADATTIDVVTPDGEAFIIWSVAVPAKEKEGSDTGRAVSEREAARGRVYTWATLRSLNTPRRQVTVDGYGRGYDPADWR